MFQKKTKLGVPGNIGMEIARPERQRTKGGQAPPHQLGGSGERCKLPSLGRKWLSYILSFSGGLSWQMTSVALANAKKPTTAM